MLAAARIGHLATADEAGAPHVIPVCFVLEGDVIYSVLDQKPKRTALNRLRRVRNILANPQVALVVDHYEEAWDRLWYILVRGRAELLLEGGERVKAIGLLRQKYDQYQDMDIDDNPVIKIVIGGTVAWGLDSGGDRLPA
ncbi:MAG: TIGR03668 family PPOX class F420-dependent oxidoreductase [Chloroflexi bacterium]|nr:TIGR03668 family PPOX class F420-dependent oxidoreductase [Chloroflexota bacterium]